MEVRELPADDRQSALKARFTENDTGVRAQGGVHIPGELVRRQSPVCRCRTLTACSMLMATR